MISRWVVIRTTVRFSIRDRDRDSDRDRGATVTVNRDRGPGFAILIRDTR